MLISQSAVSRTQRTPNDTYTDPAKVMRQLGINLSQADLSEDERIGVATMIANNRDTSAKDLSELGVTPLVRHNIQRHDPTPIHQSPEKRLVAEDQVNQMLKDGLIEPSVDPPEYQ